MGRTDELATIVAALSDAGMGGAIVVGPHGAGKSHLIREVLERLNEAETPSYRVVTVRGGAVASQYDYGALAFLASGLDASLGGNAAGLRRALRAALLGGTGDSPTLLVVDDATKLDAPTAELIQGLVGRGEAKLLATSRDMDNIGFLRLWTEGRIRRIDLPPLARRESDLHLERVLGGPASGPVKRALEAGARGNPLLLRQLAERQVSARTVVERAGAWIKVRPLVQLEAGGALETLLQGVEPGTRDLLDILSACGELPLEILDRLATADDADHLLRNPLVETLPGTPPRVRVRDRALDAFIRANLPRGRSRVLFERALAAIGEPRLPDESLLGIARWAIGCGGRLDAASSVRAARLANEEHESELAHLLAVSVDDRGVRPQLILEEARALLDMGRDVEAAEAMARHETAARDADALEHRIGVGILNATLRRSEPNGAAEAAMVAVRRLVEGQDPLPADVPGDEAAMARLRDKVLLAELDLLSWRGRYGDLAVNARRAFEALHTGGVTRLAAGAHLAEALVLTGSLEAGQALFAQLEELLGDPGIPSRIRHLVREAALRADFLSGELGRCAGILAARDPDSGGGADHPLDDVMQGLILTMANRTDDAVPHLHATLQQLKHSDAGSLLDVAAGGHALASGLKGAGAAPAPQWRPTDVPAARWDARWMASLFAVLSSTLAEDRRDSVPALMRLADDALERHAIFPALLALSAAAATGDHTSVLRLKTQAESTPGGLAAACRAFCAGILDGDARALLRAGELAAACGNQLLCHTAAKYAGAVAAQESDAAKGRAARRLEHASRRRPRAVRNETAPTTEISDFELRLVAAVADGLSSAAIGRELHLSRRTIDWHLGRLFRKLHVSGRRELAELFPGSASDLSGAG